MYYMYTTPIVEPHASIYTTPNVALLRYLARDFQPSVALFHTPRTEKLSPNEDDTFLHARVVVLAHHTHIKLSLLTPGGNITTTSSTSTGTQGTKQKIALSDPVAKAPRGVPRVDLLYGSMLSSQTSFTPKTGPPIYNICMTTLINHPS